MMRAVSTSLLAYCRRHNQKSVRPTPVGQELASFRCCSFVFYAKWNFQDGPDRQWALMRKEFGPNCQTSSIRSCVSICGPGGPGSSGVSALGQFNRESATLEPTSNICSTFTPFFLAFSLPSSINYPKRIQLNKIQS